MNATQGITKAIRGIFASRTDEQLLADHAEATSQFRAALGDSPEKASERQAIATTMDWIEDELAERGILLEEEVS